VAAPITTTPRDPRPAAHIVTTLTSIWAVLRRIVGQTATSISRISRGGRPPLIVHPSREEAWMPLMSALGQKQTSDCRPLMSALPPKADIRGGTLAMAARHRNNTASSAYNDLRRPVWLGNTRGPFSPLWLPRPCSQKIRASVLLAPTYLHNKFPTARAFGESLGASRQTNSPLGQILYSCVIKWRWAL
jgi:hypothetical protein